MMEGPALQIGKSNRYNISFLQEGFDFSPQDILIKKPEKSSSLLMSDVCRSKRLVINDSESTQQSMWRGSALQIGFKFKM